MSNEIILLIIAQFMASAFLLGRMSQSIKNLAEDVSWIKGEIRRKSSDDETDNRSKIAVVKQTRRAR